MNMKKIAILALSLCMVAAIAITGTIAYFTDADFNKNVMTLGNVKIDQIEKERDEEGKLQDFTDDKKLLPAVYQDADFKDLDEVTVEDYTINVLPEQSKNIVDKIVYVQNKGTEPAYIRTIFAFETNNLHAEASGLDIVDTYIGMFSKNVKFMYEDGKPVTFTMNGVDYHLAVCLYADAIAAGDYTEPSLRQIFMAPTANNEIIDLFGEKYDILVLSQAVQSAGFVAEGEKSAAAVGLDRAFGEVTPANALKWFSETASKDQSADL